MVTTIEGADRLAEVAGFVPILSPCDRRAAEAIVEAMDGWAAEERVAYRGAVLKEIAALGEEQLAGFLAVEAVALLVAGGARH